MTDSHAPQIVGVIFSRADLQHAIRMRNPPDFFELRLDCLVRHLTGVEKAIPRLAAPLILTARHRQEGGAINLSSRERRDLFLRFMSHASLVDVELRSARALGAVLNAIQPRGLGIIASLHDFTGTPAVQRLDESVEVARSLGADVLKIATRTDTPVELQRLVDFFERHRRTMKIAAMGIGKLGRISRLDLARRGCPLNYAHLGTSKLPGQLSIRELRQALS